MQIEAGKFYRTRDGRKVGPAQKCDSNLWPWRVGLQTYCEDGTFHHAFQQSGHDLVSEWAGPVDLTAITTPFGLLDAETQAALKAHGGPYEFWNENCNDGDFMDVALPCAWRQSNVYRVKPAPPKPREWYVVRLPSRDALFHDREAARMAADDLQGELIPVVERLLP